MKHWIIERGARLADEELARALSVTSNTSDIVATIDIDGFFLSLNQAGYELLNIEKNANVSHYRLSSYFDEVSNSAFLETDIPKAFELGVWRSERTLVTPDKLTLPCSLVIVAHKAAGEFIEYFSLILHDISAIRKAEEERNLLREQLFQSKKMETVGKLAGGIAHDFNNFLTVIMGYAELGLLGSTSAEEIRSDLRIILDTAQKAARLTAQLLDYSSKKMIEPQILDLNLVIGDSEQLLQSMMGENISFEFTLDPQLWPIRFDRSQLEQIIFNLGVNARDAMNGPGTLRISTYNTILDNDNPSALLSLPAGDYVKLTVTDTGTGMTAEVMAQIFEPFFTTKEKGKGTGLGLSAVYGAVKQNNGEIQVNSVYGEGATFEITIPAYRQATIKEISKTGTSEQPEGLSTGRETILLVEDNNEVRALLSQMLENLGYELITARDGLEGEAIFRKQMDRIDMMISDIVMPGKDGVQLAHLCQKLDPTLKVLLISGHNDEIVFFRNKNQQNIRMLNKPFPPQRLAAEVRAMLESREQI